MDITEARNQIDQIDRQITALFCRRMQCSAAIGAYKAERGLPIHVPEREAAILEALTRDADPALKPYLAALYQNIFRLSREYQQGLPEKEGPEHG